MKNKERHINHAARKTTVLIGILLAFAGFEHGLFESLQGNKPAEGFIIQAIGDDIQFWVHGTEEAFTLIPNFLITGILAMAVSIFIMIWTVRFIHRRYGVMVFLLLFILLTLVGGGIGFVIFYLVTSAYANRIRRPLTRWKKLLSGKFGAAMSRLWRPSLTVITLAWLIALEIAVFGYFPGINNPGTLLAVCWSMLLVAFLFIHIAYISAFAKDIADKDEAE